MHYFYLCLCTWCQTEAYVNVYSAAGVQHEDTGFSQVVFWRFLKVLETKKFKRGLLFFYTKFETKTIKSIHFGCYLFVFEICIWLWFRLLFPPDKKVIF